MGGSVQERMSLKRVASVTGGSSGIGLAIVQRLQVFLHSHNPTANLSRLCFTEAFARSPRQLQFLLSHIPCPSVWAMLLSAGTFKPPLMPLYLTFTAMSQARQKLRLHYLKLSAHLGLLHQSSSTIAGCSTWLLSPNFLWKNGTPSSALWSQALFFAPKP